MPQTGLGRMQIQMAIGAFTVEIQPALASVHYSVSQHTVQDDRFAC